MGELQRKLQANLKRGLDLSTGMGPAFGRLVKNSPTISECFATQHTDSSLIYSLRYGFAGLEFFE